MLHDLLPIVWDDFHFLRPQLLWLIIPLFILTLVTLFSMGQDIKWKKFIAPSLRPYVIQKGSERKNLLMYLLLQLVLACGVIGLAGPTWKQIELPGQQLETPVVVLLDMSESMLETDIPPNRMERAKFKLIDLIDENPRARMALVGFAGTAHTIVPLTHDYEIIRSHIDGLKPSLMPLPGNNINEALSLADSVMSVTTAPGTVVLLTDDAPEELIPALQSYLINSRNRIMVLPFGLTVETQSDVNMEAIDGLFAYSLTLDQSDVAAISDAIRKDLEFTEDPEKKEDQWRDSGWVLVFPVAVLILVWFRRGLVLFSILLIFSSCNQVKTFDDLWYTHDYQGQMLSNQGQYKQAALTYEDPLRQGIAYYKAGDYAQAVKAFSNDTTAYGSYNKGLAYAEMGDLSAAQAAFEQAIEMDPGLEDALESQKQVTSMLQEESEVSLDEAEEASDLESEQNIENKDMEDLGGGGQEATEEDMKQQRKEENVTTDIRKGKELDEVPEDLGSSSQQDNSKVLMRKVDDDPSLFLKRKFEYQLKKRRSLETTD